MNITILANDRALPNFLSEHGLSIHINHPIYTILFDTGYTDVYLNNAKKLGIKLANTKYMVLSHGHYDHTGGLRHYPSCNRLEKVIFHKDAFYPKYAKEQYLRFNGVPFKRESIPWLKSLCAEVVGYNEIAPSFYVLGNIPHENKNTKYYLNGKLDDFHDEIILILEEDKELSLFMGCSHFNVINGVKAVKKKFPNKRIKNLVAGMHLVSSTKEEVKEIADYLETIDFDKIIPVHCTGDAAIKYFKDRFKEKCFTLKAGDSLEI